MHADTLKAWGPIFKDMLGRPDLAEQALAENEWFTRPMVESALRALLPWFEGDQLSALRAAYPEARAERRVGLILAGNLALVGLHDVLMVLLSGHHAIVKPSHKDRVLLLHLLAHSPAAIRERVTVVEALAPHDIDFLLATGSNNTARHIAAGFAGVPMLIRQNRFSIAILEGDESAAELNALADDVLRYHGMGCRSVACILVPHGYDLVGLVHALENFPQAGLAPCWQEVLRHERAMQAMLGVTEPLCTHVVIERAPAIRAGKIGVLQVVEYNTKADRWGLVSAVQAELQCIVGRSYVPWGQAQCPDLDDFADGVDTLSLLTRLD